MINVKIYKDIPQGKILVTFSYDLSYGGVFCLIKGKWRSKIKGEEYYMKIYTPVIQRDIGRIKIPLDFGRK